MKKYLFLILMILTAQSTYSQACGGYRLNVVGIFEGFDSQNIKSIEIPSLLNLHQLTENEPESAYIEIRIVNDQFNITLESPTTSHLYEDPNNLIQFYRESLGSYPIILSKNNGEGSIIMISWDAISIEKIKDEGFGNLFKLDLKNIQLDSTPTPHL